MKNLLFFILAFLSISCYGQTLVSIEHYATIYNQKVKLLDPLNIKHEVFGSSTIQILEYNDYDEITRELMKITDTTYLYTEYFPLKLDSFLRGNIEKHIKKKGLLHVSTEKIQDSIMYVDFDTGNPLYREVKSNVLKPLGEWIERYVNGKLYVVGKFNTYGKTGVWKLYDENLNIYREIKYRKNSVTSDKKINLLLDQSKNRIRETIIGKWTKMTYIDAFIPHLMRHNNSYQFNSDGTCIKREFMLETQGIWRLITKNTLRVEFDNTVFNLRLNYVSDKKIQFDLME